ncbi:unnamed protein product [Coffea canephora]|uniref:Uncharacterized protein n=1 Tax=Coffea canephora TaxID=49390 RepID=A0A068ULK2_COFCA|nr:unnamed protein product [Coffea canephora]
MTLVLLTFMQFHVFQLSNQDSCSLPPSHSLALPASRNPFSLLSIGYSFSGQLTNNSTEVWVHIDTLSAMNGISRFCENDYPWRYSKEEGILLDQLQKRNFTYLVNEHSNITGFRCLSSIHGFSTAKLRIGFPPISLAKEPKVYIHGNVENSEMLLRQWPGC